MRVESDAVVSVGLVREDGGLLPEWSPGSHVDLALPNGMVRQYSLCGALEDRRRWQVAVLKEPMSRGGSKFLHDQLHLRDRIEVAGPRNNFQLVTASAYVFVAGGIGITPFLPMIHAVDGQDLPWMLYYGGRTRAGMAFVDELESRGDPVRVLPQDEHGLLPLEDILGGAPVGAAVYCCGPEPLLAAIEEAATGCSGVTLHLERFSAKPLSEGGEGAFAVTLERSGLTVDVPADKSIVDVLEDAGVTVQQSCLEGVCGSCETRVLGGVPDHRDSILSPQERATGKSMFICVSRSSGDRLVLDL
ncbi:MAG: 2Fe-2S iron-sulfur cluster-binding protein [Nocardioides sp.]